MVNDEEQSTVTVEAASSLFDSGDVAATDFFSTAFGGDLPPEGSTGSEEYPASASNTASNLLEADPHANASSLFENASYDSYLSESNSASVTDSFPADTDLTSTAYEQQEWQDEYVQWRSHDTNTQYAPTYDYASQQAPNDPYAPQAQDYHSPSYARQSNIGYNVPPVVSSQSSQQSYQPSYAPVQYNQQSTIPPTPSGQPSQHSYAPPVQASHQHTVPPPPPPSSLYDPPAVSTQKNTYSQPSYNNAYQSSDYQPPYANSTATGASVMYDRVPEVVKSPDVTAYRPTRLNAYDPPILPKSRVKVRGITAATVPTAQPPPSNVPYYQRQESVPQKIVSPPPPPPPPPASYYTKSSDLDGVAWGENSSADFSEELLSTEQVGDPLNGTATIAAQSGEQTYSTYGNDIDVFGNTPNEETTHQQDIQFQPEDSSGDETVGRGTMEDGDPKAGYLGEGDMTGITGTPDDTEQMRPGMDRPSSTSRTSAANEPYLPHSKVSPPPLSASPDGIQRNAQSVPVDDMFSAGSGSTFDPYRPSNHSFPQQGPTTVPNVSGTPWDPYAPSSKIPEVAPQDQYRPRSYTSGAEKYTPAYDPYTPNPVPQRSQSQQGMTAYDGEYSSPYSHLRGDSQTADTQSYTVAADTESTASYATLVAAPTYAPYAPSPSLLGTNDPLGRAAARVPVISFGFGGQLVSCFHSAGDAMSGFDVSFATRQSTSVYIRTLHEVILASAMDSSAAASYPGPLFMDPGTSSISLARTVGVGLAGNVKTKKGLLLKWLEERVDELSSGIPHIPSGSQDWYNAEGRLVLARLLKAMVENDGQLSGSASVEWAVRSALLPRLEAQGQALNGGSNVELPISSSYGSALAADANETPLAVYTLKPSALDRIQEFLLRGERRKAYHYAIDERLWAHAMLIASSVDNQAWKDVVKEFIHSELGVKQNLGSLGGGLRLDNTSTPIVNGRESLRVAYSLFSGQGAGAIQELVPSTATSLMHKEPSLAPPVSGLQATPVSPNFLLPPAITPNVPAEAFGKWQETAAMVAFSQTASDSAALTALGDYLSANRWFDAAHACYLLSPRTSSFGGLGMPAVRTVLVGSESPATLRNFNKDLDVTIFSEIVEFALSLSSSKNQEAFPGLPHLQAYKLVRASHLAEMGHVEVANRYCEAIGSTIRASSRGSQFYTPTFIGELKNLSDRLTAAPQLDKTASWISRKMAKPSLDTLGSWLESRFSKLIVGEGEDSTEPSANEATQPLSSHNRTYGPFSHYSNISSATSSAAPSRTGTPYGSGSQTLGMTPFNSTGTVPIDRAASAMDHLRPEKHRASPVPRVASASAATTTFAQAYNPVSHYTPALGAVHGAPENDATAEADGQEVAWWGSHSRDSTGPTPTAATFHRVDESEREGNFISPDDYSPGLTPMAPRTSAKVEHDEEDVEDLGFGNYSSKKSKAGPAQSNEESSDQASEEAKDKQKPEEAKPELKQQPTSWLSRWWPRASNTSPAPIKANLGEETSFYYDKELKRWVNKNASTAPAASTPPPPPPSRPRTASPAPGGLSSAPPNGSLSRMTPPPPRAASAASDLAAGRKPPRVRSNLVPKEAGDSELVPGSAPPSATNFSTEGLSGGPPSAMAPPRTKSAAGTKRNVRSRYVDILQQ